MQQTQYRHELKYRITPMQKALLERRLGAVMQTDANARPDGTYFIRSLYFDTLQDKALKEKTSGVPYREKFRIRYYNLDPAFIRLEKKSKVNRLTEKESAPLTQTQCEEILHGNFTALLKSESPLLQEFYAKTRFLGMVPRTVVDYTRRTFVCPIAETRVTFDYNIHTGIRAVDFLNPALPTVPCDAAEEGAVCVLEVKYNGFLPDHIAAVLQTDNIRLVPFSKYEISRRYD
ncbi:MAG: polyphosphate polymerase domain-containing protein [Eubacteriales bacterium]